MQKVEALDLNLVVSHIRHYLPKVTCNQTTWVDLRNSPRSGFQNFFTLILNIKFLYFSLAKGMAIINSFIEIINKLSTILDASLM